MAMISCPNCSKQVVQGFYPKWVIIVSIILFPIGLLAFLTGRKPTVCENCGHTWHGKDHTKKRKKSDLITLLIFTALWFPAFLILMWNIQQGNLSDNNKKIYVEPGQQVNVTTALSRGYTHIEPGQSFETSGSIPPSSQIVVTPQPINIQGRLINGSSWCKVISVENGVAGRIEMESGHWVTRDIITGNEVRRTAGSRKISERAEVSPSAVIRVAEDKGLSGNIFTVAFFAKSDTGIVHLLDRQVNVIDKCPWWYHPPVALNILLSLFGILGSFITAIGWLAFIFKL